MNKKLMQFALLLLILLYIDISIAKGNVETDFPILESHEIIIYVDDNNIKGPWDGTISNPYQKIQEGVDAIIDGGIIFVFSGVYYENIVINKSISLFGENKNDTIIDGEYGKYIIHVIKNNVVMENFTIRNSGGYMGNSGIKMDSKNNTIKNCIIYRTKTGIYVNKTVNNEINNCTFYKNGEAIYFKSSSNDKVIDCFFRNNALGLNIRNSNLIRIFNCYAHTNGIAFFINNSFNIKIIKCAIYDNNDNQGGLFIDHSSNINISNCIISHNGFGIKLTDCFNINILKSDIFWNTHAGITIYDSIKNIEIKYCEIKENFRFGINVAKSHCNITNNNIYNSLVEMYSEKSVCNAKNNWWGSKKGPRFLEHLKNIQLFFISYRIQFFPWLLTMIQDIGSNWSINYDLHHFEFNNSRFVEIELSGLDSDKDYIPNWWEDKWGYDSFTWNDHKHLDPDNDGLNNIEECYTDKWNSNPYHDDIFLEFDWVKAQNPNSPNKPCDKYISHLISIFEKNNITLHIDTGNLGEGEEIPIITNFSFPDLRDLYWNYFLHNNLNNPRKGIFRYCLICDYGPASGFAFIGWDHLDSFDISAQILQNNQPFYDRERLIIGGSMHELGHTLGLFVDDHGGIDNIVTTWPFTDQWWKYKNYKSCMNYFYTYKIIDYSNGTNQKNDMNDWDEIDLLFFKNTQFEWPKN